MNRVIRIVIPYSANVDANMLTPIRTYGLIMLLPFAAISINPIVLISVRQYPNIVESIIFVSLYTIWLVMDKVIK